MIETRFDTFIFNSGRAFCAAILLSLLLIAAASPTRAGLVPPDFTMNFDPGTIGPGTAAELIHVVTETNGSPVEDLAFVHTFAAGLTLASPAGASSTCIGGTLDAPAGGSTLTFSGGALAANTSCEIRVLVTGPAVATYINVTGDLTSSQGNSGTASADLIIAADRPGFSKSFSTPTATIGQRQQLTFTIDNTLNTDEATNIAFSDSLPAGLVVADPANAGNTCQASLTSPFPLEFDGGILTADPGGSVISLGSGGGENAAAVAAGETCTIEVDVVSSGVGALDNISGLLTSAPIFSAASESGRAAATLNSQGGSIVLIKEFLEDPLPPGENVSLRFTILNRNGGETASDINFSDDLDSALTGLVAAGLPAGGVCGAGSTLSGTSVLSLTDGQLPPRSQCSFDVTLQIPTDAVPGIYPNATTAIEADFGAGPVLGNIARDDLFVFAAPRLTKTFVENPAPSGGTTTIEFTIENTSTTSAVTGLTFTDELSSFLPVPLPVTLPAAGFCGPSSSISIVPLGTGGQGILVDGGELAADGSCTFQVGVDLPASATPATVINTTSAISGVVDGDSVSGNPAEAALQILAPPLLTKTFIDDPVQPGDPVELEFTLRYNESAGAVASDIAFTDDLDATLAGLVAIGLPANDVCGTGSQISGISSLALSGATLLPGQACTFRVTLTVPTDVAPGPYSNTTSAPTAMVLGQTATGLAASDTLDIASVAFEKEFVNDPALPGGAVTLRYTLRNDSATANATAIQFSDNLDGALSGLAATGLPPTDPCGAGSQLMGLSANQFLLFSGGALAPGATCTFDVDLQVPAGAISDSYISVTSNLSATVDGNPLVLPPANDTLVVDDLRLQLAKAFLNDPASPGGSVTLQFTLDNLDAASPVSDIAFTDDLNAALAGLQATGLPLVDACGAGSELAGTSLLTLSGGSLPAGGQCVFSVTLQLPASLPASGSVTNTTSEVNGLLGGLPVSGDPASDELQLQNLRFEKSFSEPGVAGGTVNLDYTITNPDPANAANGLAFSDNLGSVVAGLAGVGLPINGVCGAGSSLSGAGVLTLNNGSVPADANCSFSVVVQIPAGANPGSFPSTSSTLTSGGLEVAPAVSATLVIEPPPLFSKAFAASLIPAGAITTLTFTIDNGASTVAASNLAFSDPLPAGMVVADPANPGSTCDGVITAAPGTSAIDFSAGSVAANATCAISVDVRALEAGTLTNITSALNSSSGVSDPASAGITIEPAPVPAFSKSFTPDVLLLNQTSELALTIDNSAAQLDATALDFDDVLPAGMQIADPPALVNDCGGTATAPANGDTLQLTGGSVDAGASCQVRVTVVGAASGALVNTTSALSSSLGSSAPASATLTVRAAPDFAKAFAPDTIPGGGISRLSFTIDNSGEDVSADALAFDDPLPAGLRIATPANAATTCTGGTLSAPDGGTLIDYAGGSVAASGVCTVEVDVTGIEPGAWVNNSSPLDSTLGASPAATATLTVTEDSDGVPFVIEQQAPNGGDGNNDGIPDGLQDEVASLPSFDDRTFITVVARGGCDVLNQVVALSPASQASSPPADLVFPFGLVGFALPCENALIDVIFDDGLTGFSDRYFKFGPATPGDAGTAQWYDFGGATRVGNVWTLTLADNALGDASGDDGIINDPGGPTLSVLAVPATGHAVMALMALLLLLTAGLRLRRNPDFQ